MLLLLVMVVGSLLAAVVDVRTRRIPNALTGTLAAIAIVASVPLGVIHLSIVLVVMLIVFAIGTFAFACGWFGGGDVKLLAACCGFVGFPGALPLVLYTFGFAGIVAGVEIFRQRYLRGRLSGQSSLVGVASPGQVTVAYGVAIAAGSCLYVFSTLPIGAFLRISL